MGARARLLVMIGGALSLASVGTFVLVAVLGIWTDAGNSRKVYGNVNESAHALTAGSSLTFDGLNWSEVASVLGMTIESWPVPGSSPAEWEQLQRRSPHARTTFVGVSLYDLNEAWLCDFRANIVPLSQTVMDLRQSGSDAAFSKRLITCYPRAWVRTIFPTVGRADRVIFGFRDKARSLLGLSNDPDGTPRLRLAADYTSEERLSDWPKDRLLRRLDSMRALQGRPDFSGPKQLALLRLLQQARRQGAVVVLVLPVSPPYVAGLLGQRDIDQFEASLTKARQAVSDARWVRLDRLATLASADYFYDLVHLNMQGRSIATADFLRSLAGASSRP